ncbi:TonB-dependent receptor [Lysobacter niastensis]|uniref:TonB-dependent receptor n=1 Tax=Lysobacter niastensis TaxID=380629 RepID=A0ABS0BBY7_9GAMM|nr:TonB-dependent receptor [Lysobacter niastensis]MBF6024509.1 TonB-dependent receptor [Lysobacter niastensis]
MKSNRYSAHPHRRPSRTLLACALASCLVVAAPAALAQSTGATIRGQVTVDSVPATDAQVTATNVATGLTRRVQASGDGSYNVGGLPPGDYRIDVTAGGRTNSQVVTLKVGQTATLNLSTGGVAETAAPGAATTMEAVTVTAAPVFETKTPEVATYISQVQIESLPQASRNFLAFADIVPGMIFDRRGNSTTQLRSGAQSSNGINVFIDGVGQKNYVLKGGVSGQDQSKGNPFPQLAIGEYKVITSNYKAEYDQISSAAVTAVTKSGTNDFHGDFFWDKTGIPEWRTPTPAEERAGTKSPSGETQYGAAFGGPILRDRLFFFVTYESKEFETPDTIAPGPLPAGISLTPELLALTGPTSEPFNEDLWFGKLTWQVNDNNLVELSAKDRKEDEITDLGGLNTDSYGKTNINESTRLDLRYQWSNTNWLNDMHVTHEDEKFNPRAITLAPGFIIQDNQRRTVLNVGGGQDFQDKGQEGWGFQDDLTFTGIDGHTLKGGFKYKSVEINAFEQQPFNAQYSINYPANVILMGNTALANFQPFEVRFGAPLPGTGDRNITSKNKQYGIYFQDDWEVNDKLIINLGLRYDYEKTPSYEDFVTPANLVAALRGWSNIHQPGVDYDIEDYISTGGNRDAFKDAWQPRVGFSYDLFADQRHVIFGGAGRAYDRNLFDYLALEQSKSTFPSYSLLFNTPGNPCTVDNVRCFNWDPRFLDQEQLYALVAANPNRGSEVNLMNNDLKVPYSDQFSLGMRNAIKLGNVDWNTSATIVRIESHDGIIFSLGNRYPDGTFYGPGRTFGGAPFGNGIPGFGTLIKADNGVETKLNQLLLWAEKPLTAESPWGVTLAYTFSDGEENRANAANTDEHYVFDYPNLDDHPWVASVGIPKHRFVGTGIYERWGFNFSTKVLWSSPIAKDILDCTEPTPAGLDNCAFGTIDSAYFDDADFFQWDIAVQKSFDTGAGIKYMIRGDVFNVTDARNWSGFNNFRGVDGVIDANYGKHNDEITLPTRSFKLSFGISW